MPFYTCYDHVMTTKPIYKIGERLNAVSLTGKRILGIFRGYRNSFGVRIYGIEVGSCEPATEHICLKLSLEKVVTQAKPIRKAPSTQIQAGDPCTGLTSEDIPVTGFYMNSHSPKYRWIKGWAEGVSKFLPAQAHKVLTHTLRKSKS